jgi:uncharacterized protein (DUF488 family)
MMDIFSIGHSTLTYEQFAARLRMASVTAVADVRTSPFSRNFPHFNRGVLKESLARDGITYVFLGKELGGRPSDAHLYTDGVADYEKMAATESFRCGLDRVEQGAQKYRIALMCSERNPLDCHRCLLVGRALSQRGDALLHIVDDGEMISQDEIERRLLEMSDKKEADMFASAQELVNDAYRLRARKVAFSEPEPISSDSVAV